MYLYQDGLESERLLTRFLTPDDVSRWALFFEDKEAIKFLPDFGFNNTEEKARHMIHKQFDRYNEQRYGLQAILHKETGELLGLCGLLLQQVNEAAEVEIGYHFLRQHWGNGYATEAARLFKHYAFDNAISPSIVSIIDIGNTRSQQVASRNGMTREKQLCWLDMEVYIYRVIHNL